MSDLCYLRFFQLSWPAMALNPIYYRHIARENFSETLGPSGHGLITGLIGSHGPSTGPWRTLSLTPFLPSRASFRGTRIAHAILLIHHDKHREVQMGNCPQDQVIR